MVLSIDHDVTATRKKRTNRKGSHSSACYSSIVAVDQPVTMKSLLPWCAVWLLAGRTEGFSRAPATRVGPLGQSTGTRQPLRMANDDLEKTFGGYTAKQRLREEVESPFRTFRVYFFGCSTFSAFVALYFSASESSCHCAHAAVTLHPLHSHFTFLPQRWLSRRRLATRMHHL
jgi:hypothetical protein